MTVEGQAGFRQGAMVFALDKDSGEVLALASAAEAPGHCKPVDVRDGYWLFFAADGSPLEAVFEHPELADTEGPGDFALQRGITGLWLQERLEKVVRVRGCGLSGVEALASALRENRARRVARDAGRR